MTQSTQKHIPVLDGVRAYAVLLVCLVHFFQVDEVGLYEANRYLGIFLFKFSQIGLRGVELFFLLSGFLITGILLDSKKSPRYFSTFYARRFIRIFPLYYFVLAVSFFVLPILLPIDKSGVEVIDNQFWLWAYISNLSHFFGFSGWDASLNFPSFGHFWSLSVEEHFYVFWPLLIYFVSYKWLPRIMWFIVGISAFSVFFVYFSNDLIPILQWSTIKCAGVLSLGGIIAFYRNNTNKFDIFFFISRKAIVPLGLLFFISIFIPRQYAYYDVLTFSISVLFFASLIVLTVKDTHITNSMFKHKVLYFIGKISYGIYIYHGMLRPYFKEYLYDNLHVYIQNGIIASTLYTIICTGISVLIAWISWQLIEQPILKLKKYFVY